MLGVVPSGPEDIGLAERCLVGFNAGPPIIPSDYNNNVLILQAPEYVVLHTEMIHETRVIPLDGRRHVPHPFLPRTHHTVDRSGSCVQACP